MRTATDLFKSYALNPNISWAKESKIADVIGSLQDNIRILGLRIKSFIYNVELPALDRSIVTKIPHDTAQVHFVHELISEKTDLVEHVRAHQTKASRVVFPVKLNDRMVTLCLEHNNLYIYDPKGLNLGKSTREGRKFLDTLLDVEKAGIKVKIITVGTYVPHDQKSSEDGKIIALDVMNHLANYSHKITDYEPTFEKSSQSRVQKRIDLAK